MKNISRFFISIFIVMLFIYIAFISLSQLDADVIKTPPKIVMGLIEDVTYSSIKVNGKYYDISDAAILSIRGITLTRDSLEPGYQVEITIVGDKVSQITVSDKRLMH